MTPRTKRRAPRRVWTPKEVLTIIRQVGTVLLAVAGALSGLKSQGEIKSKGADDSSQNAAVYAILNAQQRQIDSLKWALAKEGKRPKVRYVAEERPQEPGPSRASRWLAALGKVLTGGG